MRGEIVSVDAVSGDGRIRSVDGQEFAFRSSACLAPVEIGAQVDFVQLADGVAGEVSPADAAFRFSKPRQRRAPGAMDWGSLFLTSDGRLRRSHYWIGIIILLVANRLLGVIPVIGAVAGLVTFVLCFALQARRLRDFGQPAWWLFIPLGVWIGSWALTMYSIGSYAPAGSIGLLALGAATLFALAVIIVIGVIPGQRGRNRFGPDTRPVAPEATANTFA